MRTYFLAFLLAPFLLMAQTGKQSAPPQNPPKLAGQAAGGDQQPPGQPQNESVEEFRQEAEEGIKHMLVSQVEAWNHGNLQGYMNGYWHSDEVTFFSGTSVTKGWEATLQRYQKRYQGQGNEMGHLNFQELNIDLLSRRAAVVIGRWQLTMSDGKKPGGLFTLVVKRMPGGWRIVHDHTS